MAERLTRGSSWTLFAPTDAALAATLDALGISKANLLASKAALDALLRLHIIPAKARDGLCCAARDPSADLHRPRPAPPQVPVSALRPGSEVTSLEGTRLPVRPAPLSTSVGGVKVAGLRVLRADIPATNGCIHGVPCARMLLGHAMGAS